MKLCGKPYDSCIQSMHVFSADRVVQLNFCTPSDFAHRVEKTNRNVKIF